jgi:hypothetical protein
MLWKNGQPNKVLISTPFSIFGASPLVSYLEERISFVILKTFGGNFSSLGKDIDVDFTAKLIESMPRRCQAVIDSKGDATKYY